jgi:CheY-like chemotaxis protein
MGDASSPAAGRSGRRVLVVDDNIDTVRSFARLLTLMGHNAECAINGYAALELVGSFRPEIVFLDMLLPDFDGADLARLLRLKAEPHRLSIFAITGRAGEDARRRALAAGCDDFLLKPLDPGVVERLLAR